MNLKNDAFLFSLEDGSFVGGQQGTEERRWQSGDVVGAHMSSLGLCPQRSMRLRDVGLCEHVCALSCSSALCVWQRHTKRKSHILD